MSRPEPHDPDLPGAIVLVDDGRILGGGQLFALRLARWLLTQGPSAPAPTIACPANSALAAQSRAAGVPVRDIRFPDLTVRASPSAPAAVLRMASLLREARDSGAVVVANAPRVQAFAALARMVTPRAPAVVNLEHEQETADRRSARLVLQRVGRVVAVGANTAAAYERALPGAGIHHLNNFLDPDDIDRAVASRSERTTDRPPVVGVLARLIPEKGVLEAIGELGAQPGAWAALRIGGGAQDPAYAKRVRAAADDPRLGGRAALLGPIEDVPGFLSEIDVLLVPSTGHEGQPTVILEALVHGKPVIVRRPIWSPDFTGLPVTAYDGGTELAAALRAAPGPAEPAELHARFGPGQALAAILEAAGAAP